MKKYIVILLSFGLFLMPLGALARVNADYCAGFTGDGCPSGCFNGNGSPEETCTPCPTGKYSTNGIYCLDCNKPADAKWGTSADNVGATDIDECEWSITCGENTQIDPSSSWNNSTTCTACPTGYYKPVDWTQQWSFNLTTQKMTMTNACTPKTYKIHAYIYLPKDCGNKSQELIFIYKYDSTMPDIYAKVTSEITDHEFPIVTNTKFKLYPIEQNVDLEMTLRWYGYKLGFNTDDNSTTKIGSYPNNAEFYIEIEMTEKNPIRIYYCPSQFTNSGAQSEMCKATTYNKCNKPTAPDLSDNSIFNVGFPDCSKGQYANSWKLLHPSNLTSYNWTASNNPVINFGATIELPTDTNSTYFYMAPNFTNCPSGTYNGETTCPTTCKDCPAGFTSSTGSTSKNDCYLDSNSIKFKDENNKKGNAIKILSSDVYLQ